VGLDLLRLSRTLAFLLSSGAAAPSLQSDGTGWYAVEEVAKALAKAIRRPVTAGDVSEAVTRHGNGRLELADGRVRARGGACGQTRPSAPAGPDILYHATSRGRVRSFLSSGTVAHTGGGPVHLSRQENHAWRIGHRQWEDPVVLFVDASRARREGVQFERTRSGQYTAERVPVRHVLNLRDGFAEQSSAGGFLVDWSTGHPRIALIRVSRRGGATWEVAKGKIEAGEAPDAAAVREVREEMGLRAEVHVCSTLGTVRYGFSTPDGSPRLKTVYLYVLEAAEPCTCFDPATAEGIDDVRWFDLDEALASLAHPSLRGSIGRLLQALEARAMELGLSVAAGK
jgi:putative RNA 2'-phosphotransferase